MRLLGNSSKYCEVQLTIRCSLKIPLALGTLLVSESTLSPLIISAYFLSYHSVGVEILEEGRLLK